jgi:hypothetical protein
MQLQRGVEVHSPTFSQPWRLMELGGQCVASATCPQGRAPETVVPDDGWAPRALWAGVQKSRALVATEFRTPNLPAGSESLHRLHYPGL